MNPVIEPMRRRRIESATRPVRYLVFRAHPGVARAGAYNSQEHGLSSYLRAHGVQVTLAGSSVARPGDVGLRFAADRPPLAWVRNLGEVDFADYDVVQISDLFLPGNFQAVTGAPPGTRFILYQGHYAGPSGRARWLQSIQSRITAAGLRHHPHVVLAKSAEAARFSDRWGLNPARVVGVGLDTESLLGEAAPLPTEVSHFLARRGFVLLYVGALDDRRRLDWVLSHLRTPVLSLARLLVVGTGPAASRWREESADLVAQDRVCFVERLSQDQLRPVYVRANALVLPTRYEIYGMVGLEALLFDLPVIASAVAGPIELAARAPDRVVLVEPGPSPDRWHRALLDAVTGHGRLRQTEPDVGRVESLSWRGPGRAFLDAVRQLTA